MLKLTLKYSIAILLILFSKDYYSINSDDSLYIEKKIEEGYQRLLEQKKQNEIYILSGEYNKLNFLINVNDRITDTIVNGNNHYLTDTQLEQKLNDSLRQIYLTYQLETYLILANYHQVKINARLTDSTNTVNIKDLFSNTSKWYAENSDINSIKDNSYNISLGISNRIKQSTNSNFLSVGLSVWKIQYLESKEGLSHSYSIFQNVQNSFTTDVPNLLQYYNNVQNSFKNSAELNKINTRNSYAQQVVSVLNRAARNVGLRLQILQATNSTQLESIYQNFNNTDYFALSEKERLHTLRIFIRNSYPEATANKVLGLVSKDLVNSFYDSLLITVNKATTSKKYLKWVIENTDGNDLDNLFTYFVRNFNYYYINKVSSYSNENDYEIINLTETPIDIGDATINKADITSNFEIDLEYQVITDLNVDIFPRQTADNTQVATNNNNTSVSSFEVDDYLFQSQNYNETINPVYETISGITNPYKPISVSYTGDDEDINSSMNSNASALVPAFYLYYIKNEQNKEKVKNYIINGATITLEVIAVLGSDGLALPLIQTTKYGNTALKVYKAANYLSLGLTGATALTNSPELEALKSKLDIALTIVNLPATVKTLPSAWKSVKTIAKNTTTKTSNIITSAKLEDIVLTLKTAKNNLAALPQATRKQVMKLYYYLKKRGVKIELSGKAALLSKLVSHPNVLSLVSRLDDVTDATLISKLDDIATNNPSRLTQLEDLYNPSTFSLPADRPFLNGTSGAKVGGDFNITKVIDGQNVSVYYNKAGYPNFNQFSAGSDYNFVSNALTGLGGDMTLANNAMKQKFLNQPNKFIWDNQSSWFEIADANGNLTKYTWHHYQDGRKMFPVPSKIHNATAGGFNHTGGKAIIAKGLQDLFE